MQPLRGLRARTSQLVTTASEHAHHHQVRVDLDLHQIRRPQHCHGHECASTGSVLRPLPVADTRTRADSF
ncbi:MAG TPA: hypothetical protein VEX40_15955, partial [Mycobacterium sp.]|nr:hypothetical protein [Mycobacterium sp.]